MLYVETTGDVQKAIALAEREGLGISIAGGRHAMGGQQFGQGTILLDMSKMNRVVALDTDNGRRYSRGRYPVAGTDDRYSTGPITW